MNWNNWCLQNWLSVFSDVITPIKWLKERNMKLLHRLWLKINDIGEYDVKYGALDSATNIITYMSLAKEFWNQKHAFIENQLKYKQ